MCSWWAGDGMEWKTPTEYAAIGFFGYGALSLALSPSVLHFLLCAGIGAVVGAMHAYLRPLPWKNYAQRLNPFAPASEKKSACVSVYRNLRFKEVSTKIPEGSGYIRIHGMDKRELFERLKNKTLNLDTIPFHLRVILEEGRSVDVPWMVIEPHLKAQ